MHISIKAHVTTVQLSGEDFDLLERSDVLRERNLEIKHNSTWNKRHEVMEGSQLENQGQGKRAKKSEARKNTNRDSDSLQSESHEPTC